MDDFLTRRGSRREQTLGQSKTAASHTDQNLKPSPPPPQDSDVVVGHLHAPKPKKTFSEWLKGITKRQWIATGVIAGLLLIGGGLGLFFALKGDKQPVAQSEKKEAPAAVAPQPTTVASRLTGVQVDPAVNDRPVTAVMTENTMDARPQAGLNHAGVIFEAVAEGGITRFLALFMDTEPDYVGPVRSVRPYYIQWAMGFDAAIAHAGGSAEALNNLKQWGAKDLNHHASYFWRVSNRTAPHNLYTSIPKLREYEAQKGFAKANFTNLTRSEKESPAASPTVRKIDFNVSSSTYNVHYDYDPASNNYQRSEGGKPHIEERSGQQLAPKVVVALIMAQGKSSIYTTYATIGSGQAVVFQDGISIDATWKKESNSANFVFTDASGKPLKLNPGQTWFTVLGGKDRITQAP